MSAEGNDRHKSVPKRDLVMENLKRVYDETVNEALPEQLAELLDRLREKRQK